MSIAWVTGSSVAGISSPPEGRSQTKGNRIRRWRPIVPGRWAVVGLTLAEAARWHDVECASYRADLDLWLSLAADARGTLLDLRLMQ